MIFIKGATMWEAQIGFWHLRILRWSYINKRSWPWIRLGKVEMANPATGNDNRITNVVRETVGSYPQIPESIYEKIEYASSTVISMSKKKESSPSINKFNLGAN